MDSVPVINFLVVVFIHVPNTLLFAEKRIKTACSIFQNLVYLCLRKFLKVIVYFYSVTTYMLGELKYLPSFWKLWCAKFYITQITLVLHLSNTKRTIVARRDQHKFRCFATVGYHLILLPINNQQRSSKTKTLESS